MSECQVGKYYYVRFGYSPSPAICTSANGDKAVLQLVNPEDGKRRDLFANVPSVGHEVYGEISEEYVPRSLATKPPENFIVAAFILLAFICGFVFGAVAAEIKTGTRPEVIRLELEKQ
jgi:hypothetical protein